MRILAQITYWRIDLYFNYVDTTFSTDDDCPMNDSVFRIFSSFLALFDIFLVPVCKEIIQIILIFDLWLSTVKCFLILPSNEECGHYLVLLSRDTEEIVTLPGQ